MGGSPPARNALVPNRERKIVGPRALYSQGSTIEAQVNRVPHVYAIPKSEPRAKGTTETSGAVKGGGAVRDDRGVSRDDFREHTFRLGEARLPALSAQF